MPNRIIKESICTSETIDGLSWFDEVVFYRLIVNCDDYGRFDGRIQVIKSRLFPLKTVVTEKALSESIHRLSTVGLVKPYIFDGKLILQLTTWDRHQNVRNHKSKYPAIDGKTTTSADENIRLISIDINCDQLLANVPVIQSNPIQSESESESNPYLCTEPETASMPPAITLTLNDKSEYPFSAHDLAEYQDLYPAVDVAQQFRKMQRWIKDNPTKRKTKTGIRKFVSGWLSKEQDRGGSKRAAQNQTGGNVFAEMLREEGARDDAN